MRKQYLFYFFIFLVQCSCIQKDAAPTDSIKTTTKRYIELFGYTQGTTYSVIYQEDDSINYQVEIDSILAEFDRTASTYDSSSIISRINRDEEGIVLNYMFKDILNKAFLVSEETSGMFDVTVGQLVNAWGFGPSGRLIDGDVNIDSLRNLVGYKKISIEGDTLKKNCKGIRLDFNAIAQGYSVDIICHFLDKKGIDNYLIEIGGEVRTKGVNKKGELWRIGIDKPVEGNILPGRELQAIIQLNNKALATSGNYRKFYVKDGVKYVHSINPITGYPIEHNLLSATIIADDCMTADAYATACMVMGLKKSIEFVKSNDIDAYFIYINKRNRFAVYSTKRVKRQLVK